MPHYVSQPPNPKATLALLNRLEDLIDMRIPLGELPEDARAWQLGVDQLAAEDSEVAEYVQSLEEARDTAELPEASGEAIAREFERYLRRRDGGGPASPPGGHATESGDPATYLRDGPGGRGRPPKPLRPEATDGTEGTADDGTSGSSDSSDSSDGDASGASGATGSSGTKGTSGSSETEDASDAESSGSESSGSSGSGSGSGSSDSGSSDSSED